MRSHGLGEWSTRAVSVLACCWELCEDIPDGVDLIREACAGMAKEWDGATNSMDGMWDTALKWKLEVGWG